MFTLKTLINIKRSGGYNPKTSTLKAEVKGLRLSNVRGLGGARQGAGELARPRPRP
jgi:hypothetical protein